MDECDGGDDDCHGVRLFAVDVRFWLIIIAIVKFLDFWPKIPIIISIAIVVEERAYQTPPEAYSGATFDLLAR